MEPSTVSFSAPVVVCVIAVLLDLWWGEPRRWHPLVGFGGLVTALERRLNRASRNNVARGGLAVGIAVVPLTLLAFWVEQSLPWPLLLLTQSLVLWLALSLSGLAEHGRAVSMALHQNDLAKAQVQVGRIVSRRAEQLDENGVAAAASESMLENGADAVFASLFWFLVAGLPGVIVHRLVNTLDAMWGYRNERFLTFGRVAARLDDVLNWVPARLTALTYTLLGHTRSAWRCWRTQAPLWDSPNAGPVMAAGAGALSVTLGGPAPYGSGIKQRPILGAGPLPTAATIDAAIALVQKGVLLWLALLFVIVLIIAWVNGVL